MDPPLINENSFSAANPSSYSLAEIWPFSINPGSDPNVAIGGGLGLKMENLGWYGHTSGPRDGSMEESTVTEQSGGCGGRKRRDLSSEDESSKIVSTTSSANDLSESNGKWMKTSGSKNGNGSSKAEVEASSAAGSKSEQNTKPEPPKQDYIHVRARRGQATDSHSLAERARREKISEKMKILQDLVPGCNKFLSMKLEVVNSRMSMDPSIEGFHSKDFGGQPTNATGMIYSSEVAREYAQGSQGALPEWLHMQLGGSWKDSIILAEPNHCYDQASRMVCFPSLVKK
ncbi:hypothetical protein SLEP1_g2982 [Rubroshorea leprosula]|uniref:BHLH domain-containing protein n=1 Tax=Rubroshorea leprosula TaxID=152421 RepID=A0AAV5HPQ0_9ROSI|nr:hypothetical protein SLEP1_g2982 [Rubroshorea leprosula]